MHKVIEQGESASLPIRPILKRLNGLDNASRVVRYLNYPTNEVAISEHVTTEMNGLIAYFNLLSDNDPILGIGAMSASRSLKMALGDETLPMLRQISRSELLKGLKNAVPAILAGQKVRRGESTKADFVIKTPSMPTNATALIIGTSFHVYEQSVLAGLRMRGLQGVEHGDGEVSFRVDDIIHPLVECALLQNARTKIGDSRVRSRLLPVIINKNSRHLKGGLGWKKPTEVVKFEQDFALYEIGRFFSDMNIGDPDASPIAVLRSYQSAMSFPTLTYTCIRLIGAHFDSPGDVTPRSSSLVRLGVLASMAFAETNTSLVR